MGGGWREHIAGLMLVLQVADPSLIPAQIYDPRAYKKGVIPARRARSKPRATLNMSPPKIQKYFFPLTHTWSSTI